MKDYYGILEVPRNASQGEITRAYRRLARNYHPDTTQGDKKTGEGKMKEINEAYAVLSDFEERRKHDARWESSKTIHVAKAISFEDSLLGCEIPVRDADGNWIDVTIPENVRGGQVISKGYIRVIVSIQPSSEEERDEAKLAREIMREFGVDATLAKKIRDKFLDCISVVSNEHERVVDELKSENASLERGNEQLSKRADQLHVENIRLRSENGRLSEDNRNLETDKLDIIDTGRKIIDDLSTENDYLREAMDHHPIDYEYPDNENPPRQYPDNRGTMAPEDLFIHSAEDLFTQSDPFDPHPSDCVEPIADSAPGQGSALDGLLSAMRNNASELSPGDARRKNTPKPPRDSGRRNSGRYGSLRSDVGGMRRDIKGRGKKR